MTQPITGPGRLPDEAPRPGYDVWPLGDDRMPSAGEDDEWIWYDET
jgi:hypothetical protein